MVLINHSCNCSNYLPGLTVIPKYKLTFSFCSRPGCLLLAQFLKTACFTYQVPEPQTQSCVQQFPQLTVESQERMSQGPSEWGWQPCHSILGLQPPRARPHAILLLLRLLSCSCRSSRHIRTLLNNAIRYFELCMIYYKQLCSLDESQSSKYNGVDKASAKKHFY